MFGWKLISRVVDSGTELGLVVSVPVVQLDVVVTRYWVFVSSTFEWIL